MSVESERYEERLDELEARVCALEDQQNASTPLNTQDEFVSIPLANGDTHARPSLRQELLDAITGFERAYGDSAPIEYVNEELLDQGYDTDEVRDTIDQLLREGSIYEPVDDHVKVV